MAAFLQTSTGEAGRPGAGRDDASPLHGSSPQKSSWTDLVSRVSCGGSVRPARISSVHAAALAFKAALQQQSSPSTPAGFGGYASFTGSSLPKAPLPAADVLGSIPQNGGLAAALTKFSRVCKRLAAPGGNLLLFEDEDSAGVSSGSAGLVSGGGSGESGDSGINVDSGSCGGGAVYGVDVAAFASLRRQAEEAGASGRSAALLAACQTAAAASLEEDLREWRQQRTELFREWLLDTEAADSLGGLDEVAQKLLTGGNQLGSVDRHSHLASNWKTISGLPGAGVSVDRPRPHPLLTHVENELLLILSLSETTPRLEKDARSRNWFRKVPMQLLLQLPAAAAEAASAASMDFESPSSRNAKDAVLAPSPVDGWSLCSPGQTHQFSSLILLIVSSLACLDDTKSRQEPLAAFVSSALAVLEDDRRKACGAPDFFGEAAQQHFASVGHDSASSAPCCGSFLAVPWLQQAAAELAALEAEETVGSEDLWWLAVYSSFRAGDVLCLLSLGGAGFLDFGRSTLAAASAAATAAASAGTESLPFPRGVFEEEGLEKSWGEFGNPPKMLGFVCRQLLALLLRKTLPAATVASGIASGAAEEKSRKALIAALPLPEALEPPASTSADIAECCVLYPPERGIGKGGVSGYLRLMLSLIKPDVWKPVPASSLSEGLTQEDFLHFKLFLLLLQASEEQQPRKREAILEEGLWQLSKKVRMQGAAYFDSSDSADFASSFHGVQRTHELTLGNRRTVLRRVNFGYALMLSLCGGIVASLLWLMESYPFLRRPCLLLLLLLYKGGALASDSPFVKLLLRRDEKQDGFSSSDSILLAEAAPLLGSSSEREEVARVFSTSYASCSSVAEKLFSLPSAKQPFDLMPASEEEGKLRETQKVPAFLAAALEVALSDADPLAQVCVLDALPLHLTFPLVPSFAEALYSSLTAPGILVDDGGALDEVSPGLLEHLVIQQRQRRRAKQQQMQRDGAGFYRDEFNAERVGKGDGNNSAWSAFDGPWDKLDSGEGDGSRLRDDWLRERRDLLADVPLLFFLFCALRVEALRRNDLQVAFAAAWLVTDTRSAAESLICAFEKPPLNEREKCRFFLKAFRAMKRRIPVSPELSALAFRCLFEFLVNEGQLLDAVNALELVQVDVRTFAVAGPRAVLMLNGHELPPALAQSVVVTAAKLLQQVSASGFEIQKVMPFNRLLSLHLAAEDLSIKGLFVSMLKAYNA